MATGLKLGKPGAIKGKPTIDVSKLDIAGMLQKQLNIGPAEIKQLMMQLQTAKTPQEAAMIIKQFDHNPQTMNQPFDPNAGQAQGAQAAPADATGPAAMAVQPAAGLQLGK